ncbi:MAG: PIG-L family deacetylase [Defluviitaleaceae bacterium]|nr:PIG-L family deacetylase [Defluviitaleaceae bacterium]
MMKNLCIAAHHDDVEIMAYAAIAKCYGSEDNQFTAVVVTDGSGSLRNGIYAGFTDKEMMEIREREQKAAAEIGRYNALFLLAEKSNAAKDPKNRDVTEKIKKIILETAPDTIYTHNLADKHDTHVAVAMHVIRALRELPIEKRPSRVIAMEVWRSLDWLCDEDKVVEDTSPYPNTASALIGVFDSQVSSKRYDLAAIGRRLANATFYQSNNTDDFESVSYGMDITELVNSNISPVDFINKHIDKFKNEVQRRLEVYL